MKFFITIYFLIYSPVIFSQEKICSLNSGDICIVHAKTENQLVYKASEFTMETVLTRFGKPDSSKVEEMEAAGGKIETFQYNQDYFYFPKSENSTSGFSISSPEFYVTIKDTLIVKIGEGTDRIMNAVCEQNCVKKINAGNSRFSTTQISYFSIPYTFFVNQKTIVTDESFTITYDPQEKVILDVSQHARH